MEGEAKQGIPFQPRRRDHSLSARPASEEFGSLVHKTSVGHKESGRNQGKLEEGLNAIDECDLPGKLKLWCLQFGLMPRLMWLLTVYEVVMSHVEHMQQHSSIFIRKWLGVSSNLKSVTLHGRGTKV